MPLICSCNMNKKFCISTTPKCVITSNDRPFGCKIICTDIYSQCYFLWHLRQCLIQFPLFRQGSLLEVDQTTRGAESNIHTSEDLPPHSGIVPYYFKSPTHPLPRGFGSQVLNPENCYPTSWVFTSIVCKLYLTS